MIILDTHVWVASKELGAERIQWLDARQADGLGINSITLWEVAKLVEHERLSLPCPVEEWMQQALSYPGIQIVD